MQNGQFVMSLFQQDIPKVKDTNLTFIHINLHTVYSCMT